MERFDKLLFVIHESLKDLQLAIKGQFIFTQELEEMYDSFLQTRVPALWQVSNYYYFLFTCLIEISVLVLGKGKLTVVYQHDEILYIH